MLTLELGSAPVNEDCAQVGDDDYEKRSYKELTVYRRQILRTLRHHYGVDGIIDLLADENELRIVLKSFTHDLGRYREVVVVANENNQDAVDIAFWIESNLPVTWDDESRKDLEN